TRSAASSPEICEEGLGAGWSAARRSPHANPTVSTAAALATHEISVFDMAAYSGERANARQGPRAEERDCPIWEEKFRARGGIGPRGAKKACRIKAFIP